jgi:hypothetical protein
MPRNIKKLLITPASACKVAYWAVGEREKRPEDERFASIAGSVFTAFMIEGVVHCIGCVLCPKWEDGENPPARLRFPGRHKTVRALIHLDNTSGDYQRIQPIIKAVFNFRDQFAHPKILRSTSTGETSEFMRTPIPPTDWELQLSHVKTNFETLRKYGQCLLDGAADQLDAAHARDFGRTDYPNLSNVQKEAALLRLLLEMEDFSEVSF